jgi:hypothetical protein
MIDHQRQRRDLLWRFPLYPPDPTRAGHRIAARWGIEAANCTKILKRVLTARKIE